MQVLIEHRKDVKLEHAVVSKNHIVVFQREKGQQVRPLKNFKLVLFYAFELSGWYLAP